jgi:hypothetical protein
MVAGACADGPPTSLHWRFATLNEHPSEGDADDRIGRAAALADNAA